LSAKTGGNEQKWREKPIPLGTKSYSAGRDFDSDEVRDDLLDLVREKLADPAAVVVIDETGGCRRRAPMIGSAERQAGVPEEVEFATKGECGLDQYEVRSWTGWYRHITLSLLAQLCATLMTEQATTEQEKKAWEPNDGPSSLENFKRRRGLAVC
jgi:SRSO17 transposase